MIYDLYKVDECPNLPSVGQSPLPVPISFQAQVYVFKVINVLNRSFPIPPYI